MLGPRAARDLAVDINGSGVIDNAQTTIGIAPGGVLGGAGGCNRLRGRATLDGTILAFGPMAATGEVCLPA